MVNQTTPATAIVINMKMDIVKSFVRSLVIIIGLWIFAFTVTGSLSLATIITVVLLGVALIGLIYT